jgi:hypothetical protein
MNVYIFYPSILITNIVVDMNDDVRGIETQDDWVELS